MAAAGGAGLRKNTMLDIADTNMANFGTKLEHDIKEAAAKGEPAWDPVGGPGMWIWRIEKFHVVPWPVEEHGNFYTGDSYICLYSRPKPGQGDRLIHDIHFWLGRYTTQDEYGTAAYKTVELDDRLGGAATQHREVQGHESQEFIQMLLHCPTGKKTMYLMEGGVESGFRHVEPEQWIPRLLWVRRPDGGGKQVQISEVPCCLEALNRGDVYILDCGLRCYQWNGAEASPFERAAASQECGKFTDGDDARPDAKHHVVDDDGGADLLKGSADMKAVIKPATPDQLADLKLAEEHGKQRHEFAARRPSMHRLSDAGGELTFSLVGTELDRAALDSADAFVVDKGAQVYVWVGAKASPLERKMGLSHAFEYAKKSGCPLIPIARVSEGAEGEAFFSGFK